MVAERRPGDRVAGDADQPGDEPQQRRVASSGRKVGGGRGRCGRVSGLREVVNHVRCCLEGALDRVRRRVKPALS